MSFETLSLADWGLFVLCALLVGANKSGLRGVTIIIIPALAVHFGAKFSVAVVLPLLVTGDFVAMAVYHTKISWKHFFRLLPATVAGLAAGMVLGQHMSDQLFLMVLACLILFCLMLMIIKEFSKKQLELPDHWAAHGLGGFSGGFSTMVGNAAGPIMAVYLLSMNLPKEVFIGTGAVFFMFVNLLKVPVHLFVWKTMGRDTLLIDVFLIPVVLLGFFIGLKVVKRIPERPFRLFIIAATLIGTVKLFF